MYIVYTSLIYYVDAVIGKININLFIFTSILYSEYALVAYIVRRWLHWRISAF